MSQVVGLHGEDVPHLSLAERADEAKVALRHLLDAIEAGDVAVDQWLFLYDAQDPKDERRIFGRSLDSGLSTAEGVYMANAFVFDTMIKVRDMVPK